MEKDRKRTPISAVTHPFLISSITILLLKLPKEFFKGTQSGISDKWVSDNTYAGFIHLCVSACVQCHCLWGKQGSSHPKVDEARMSQLPDRLKLECQQGSQNSVSLHRNHWLLMYFFQWIEKVSWHSQIWNGQRVWKQSLLYSPNCSIFSRK